MPSFWKGAMWKIADLRLRDFDKRSLCLRDSNEQVALPEPRREVGTFSKSFSNKSLLGGTAMWAS